VDPDHLQRKIPPFFALLPIGLLSISLRGPDDPSAYQHALLEETCRWSVSVNVKQIW
jgi:hypothetical protein